MTKRSWACLIIIAPVICALLTGCVTPMSAPVRESMPAPTKTLDIGVAAPITGVAAFVGENVKDTILMAIDDQNTRGGVTIAGDRYLLNPIVLDTKLDLVVGKSVAEQLVYDKKVKVIIGPFLSDAVGVQAVTEPNKVIILILTPLSREMTGPNKPYTFFYGNNIQFFATGAAYIQKFYPGAKNVFCAGPALPDTKLVLDFCQKIYKSYGLNWIDAEQFPVTTTDFQPFLGRVLAKNPDIVDTSNTGGAMAGRCAQLVKQIREAGYTGLIWVPSPPPQGMMEEIVPEQYRYKIIINETDWESPIVSDIYRTFVHRFVKQYNTYMDPNGLLYSVTRAFFEFLNTQNTLDTTALMEAFARYHWQGLNGKETFWIGKPFWGIDRMAIDQSYVSEYVNGKLETKWEAPVPLDILVGQQ